jgi:SCY1-like protein 2
MMTNSKPTTKSNSTILDKYTVQEKIVPLLKVMKTKEPAVMMAALAVFRQVGKIADAEFLAMDVLPILWSFSLGPLLNLQQFQEFMTLIKALSSKIEQEQTRKLRDLSSSNTNGISNSSRAKDLMNMGSTNAMFGANGQEDVGESDFERLVLGRGGAGTASSTDMLGDNPRPQPQRAQSTQVQTPTFSWSTPPMSTAPAPTNIWASIGNPGSRTITPDNTLFSAANSRPAQDSRFAQTAANGLSSFPPMQPMAPSASLYSGMGGAASTMPVMQPLQPQSTFSIAPPPQTSGSMSAFSIPPPPSQGTFQNQYGGLGANRSISQSSVKPIAQHTKKGLDAYESLI